MYSYLKLLGIKSFILQEAPYCFTAGIISELFYKWGSFSLELIAFLFTWTALSFVGNKLFNKIRKHSSGVDNIL